MKIILPVTVFLLITAVACNSHNNQQSINILSKSLERVNLLITENNHIILAALEEKTKDPQTRLRAVIWAPKALVIKEKSAVLFQYIDDLKKQVTLLKEDDISGAGRVLDKEANILFDKLLTFGHDVIEALDTQSSPDNPAYQAQLNKEIKAFKKDIGLRFKTVKDSASDKAVAVSDWTEHNIGNVTPALALAMLNKLQNDVLVTENLLLEYCNNSSVMLVDYYETVKPLISMNRSYVKSGQSIEVYAGVALFRSSADPHITIDGKPVKADEDGVATWSFTAKTKPGKYKVPVTIEYLKPDGTRIKINKKIKYTVAE
jgi:hypothetical protein